MSLIHLHGMSNICTMSDTKGTEWDEPREKKALNLWMKIFNLWQELEKFLMTISLRRPSLNLINPFEWKCYLLNIKKR